MKVGILTFHFVANYGAVFQAFALKKAIEKQSVDVSIIDYRPASMTESWNAEAHKKWKQSMMNLKNKPICLKTILLYLYGVFSYCEFLIKDYPIIKRKYNRFDGFVKDILQVRRSDLLDINDYDIIICGSDQIWNIDITSGFDNYYYSSFLNKSQIKASYAASVGDLTIITSNPSIEHHFVQLVTNFDFVSVREHNLEKFLSSKSISAQYLPDPTFLLDSKEYYEIMSKKIFFEDYILLYHLQYDKKLDSFAHKIGKERNLKVVSVSGTMSGTKRTLKDTSPSDFLELLFKAKMIVTNSFHGVALSIVFNKEFYVRLPKLRKDRIIDILTEYNLMGRIIDSDTFIRQNEDAINYGLVNQIIDENRQLSISFLKKVINYVK